MNAPPPAELDARGRATLAAVLVPDNAPEVQLVRGWLDSWSGVGLVLAGMAYQGWDVQLTAYAACDWRDLLPGRHRTLHRRRVGVR